MTFVAMGRGVSEMTREEAVVEINHIIKTHFIDAHYSCVALDMSIESLKQPQVVFCSECFHSSNCDQSVLMQNQEYVMNYIDYCSFGERRTECIEEEKPKKKKSEKSSYELERGL